jgi:hypothetical protein
MSPFACQLGRHGFGIRAIRSGPILAITAALTLSCTSASSSSAAEQFAIEVQVESDPGKPLAAAQILRGAAELGRTAESGTARVALEGRSGDVIMLQVACPEGYAAQDKSLSVTLRPFVGNSVPQYRAECRPLMRSLVVAVRAKGGTDLPVKYLGREIARTDAEGVAHALLKVPPTEQVTLVLDTSDPAHERLRPKSPEFTLVMRARDEVAVFDQSFTLQPLPRTQAKPRRPVPLGPQKITRQP